MRELAVNSALVTEGVMGKLGRKDIYWIWLHKIDYTGVVIMYKRITWIDFRRSVKT